VTTGALEVDRGIVGSRERLAIAAMLVVGALLLYAQVAQHQFVFYDDPQYVFENPRVRAGLSWANVAWAFTTLHFSNWHPLTWLAHMLDVELFGLAPGAHHLVNAALHAVNGAVLFLVLDRMTGARWRSAAVAALFAVHPLHVESVAWLAERKDLLSTLFGFLALLAYQRWVERPRAARYALVVLCFALSLLAKPMWVTLPFVLLLLDAWPLGRTRWLAGDASSPSAPVGVGRLLLEKAPLLALSAASSAVTLVAQHRGGAVAGLELAPAARVANALVAYAAYVGKTLWPTNLAAFYPLREVAAWEVVGAALALLAITAASVAGVRRFPWATVGWLWFVGMLVPVIGLVQVGGQAMADRYTYVPSVGLFVAIVWGAHSLARDRSAAALGAAAALAISALATLTWAQTSRWIDHETIFRDAIAVTGENPQAHGILAMGLRRGGKLQEALLHASEAARLEPANARHPLTAAIIERDLRRFGAAYVAARRSVELEPSLGIAWTVLGQTAGDLGRADEAEAVLRRATVLQPEDFRAWNELGAALARNGRVDEALSACRTAVALDPGSASAWSNLASVLQRVGRTAEAGEAFAAATRADPGNPVAWRNLGVYFAQVGRAADAADAFRHGLRLRPADPDLLVRLGLAQLAQGARTEALVTAAQLEAISREAAAELRARAER
jgi:Flp pilus assembly protein TadD